MTLTQQTTELHERNSLGTPANVDEVNGVIYGVKVLGRDSRNGRTYSESAMRDAARLYEGAKVNVNHASGRDGRSYQDRIGVIRNVSYRDGAIRGDLHYNAKHALAEQ